MEYWESPENWPDHYANWVDPDYVEPDDEIIDSPIGRIPVRLYAKKMAEGPKLAPWVKEEYLKPGETFTDTRYGLVPTRDPYLVCNRDGERRYAAEFQERSKRKKLQKWLIAVTSLAALLAGGCGYLLYLVTRL